MQCPQCADFLKPNATSCRECGWQETPAVTKAKAPPPAWSPPAPAFRDEPWRRHRPMTPAELAPFLEELRRITEKIDATTAPRTLDEKRRLDPEQEANYLFACQARKSSEPHA